MKQLLIICLFTMAVCVCDADQASAPLLASAADMEEGEFSMSIMDVFSIRDQGTILTGQVLSGSLVIGDVVCIPLKNGETAARTVEGIEMFRKLLDRAEKGQSVGVLVEIDKKLVEKGALLHPGCELEEVTE
jgi:elongation factor Tu